MTDRHPPDGHARHDHHHDHARGEHAHAEHEHAHEHDHEHAHGDPDHAHSHPHVHRHAHDHEHDHDYARDEPDHEHAHRSHDHDHDHHAHEPEHPHGHDHDHPHGHDHDHPHGHDHDHPHGSASAAALASRRPELERGAGEGKTLFFDLPSGIAGDMSVAALVDLGVPFSAVIEAVGSLGLKGFSIEITPGFAGAIGASRFTVTVDQQQPERRYAAIDELLAVAPLPPRTQSLARAIFRRLAEAEAEVHRTAIEDVHFHEVGAIDAIVDIVAAAACLDFIGADSVVSSPLPLGRGRVKSRHGMLPLPAPASLLCLRGVPTYDAGIEAELVTPTGAAIIATAASSFTGWPSFIPERVGWGMGTMVLADRPNAVRAVLGEPWQAVGVSSTATHAVVETNIDDLSGELAGHALSALLEAGALDAWLTPIQMKKGRPGLTLSALCPITAADRIGAILLRETSTLGYRKQPVTRGERPRRIIQVPTPYGVVPVKVGTGPWGSPQIKPEFDACAALAADHGVAVRDVVQVALVAARQELGEL